MAEEQRPDEELIQSVPVTDEDRFYLEQLYKEPVESLARIEDTAKFLAGATATTSGVFLAAVKLASGAAGGAAASVLWFLPVVLWVVAILLFVRVLVPRRFSVGERDPSSIKRALLELRESKYRLLQVGTWLFLGGLVSAAVLFFQ
ncbi:MAG: hypothetical protein V3T83_21130 [Acidobacteriota bacterium]